MAWKLALARITDDELENLICDHYRGEAQTLSKGSEENLLKLGELRGTATEQERARFEQIKTDFVRLNKLDGAGSPIMMAVEQMGYLHESLEAIANKLSKNNLSYDYSQSLHALGESSQSQSADAINTLTETLSDTLAQAPDKNSFTKLIEVIKTSSNQSQLIEINNTLGANNVNQTIAMLGQHLGELIAQNDNRAEIKALSAVIKDNNVQQQLANLVKAWSGKQ